MSLDLTKYIRNVPDFPVKGILFRDITPLLRDPAAYAQALDALTAYVVGRNADAVVGIESRGFLFGAPIAQRLGLPFVPIRKPGKLPAATMSVEYALEYGQGNGQLDIHATRCRRGARRDRRRRDGDGRDGGSGSGKLVEMLGAEVAGIAFLIAEPASAWALTTVASGLRAPGRRTTLNRRSSFGAYHFVSWTLAGAGLYALGPPPQNRLNGAPDPLETVLAAPVRDEVRPETNLTSGG